MSCSLNVTKFSVLRALFVCITCFVFPLAKSRVCPDGQSILLFILAKRKKAGLSLESLTSTTSTIRQMTSLIIAACCFVTIISLI